MAGSSGQHSYGAKLFYAPFGQAAPGAALTTAGDANWFFLGEVFSINGVPMNPSVTKLTHLNSDGKASEKVPGITDAGQATLRLNYYAALMVILQTMLPDDTDTAPAWGRFQFAAQFPDGGQWYLTGFVQGVPVEVPEDDRITVETTIEISGRPAFASL